MTAVKVLFLLTPYLIRVKKVLSNTEIKVLDKSFSFSPTPSLINEADLQRDFDEFARKMRWKWYFRKESQYIPSKVSI